MRVTNYSGKFVEPRISHAASTATGEGLEREDVKKTVIPPAPTPPAEYSAAVTGSRMDNIRELFGRLWWLWLVVIVWWLMKGE